MFKLTPFSQAPRKRDDFVDFYNVIEDFFNDSPLRSFKHDTFKIDVEEKDGKYVIKADLPGISKDDVKVSYEDQALMIMVEHAEEKSEEDKERNYLHKERYATSMRRRLHLPDLEPSKMKAKLENGVLTIHAEKTEEQHQGHYIDVE